MLAMKKIDLSKHNAATLRSLENEMYVEVVCPVSPQNEKLIGSTSPFSRLHCSFDHDFIVRVDSFENDEENNCRLIFMEVS